MKIKYKFLCLFFTGILCSCASFKTTQLREGQIETGKAGYCRIDTEIIDLSNNSIIQKSLIDAREKINGKWKTPPEYGNLEKAIETAITATILKGKNYLNK
jgi:hypothetical protein